MTDPAEIKRQIHSAIDDAMRNARREKWHHETFLVTVARNCFDIIVDAVIETHFDISGVPLVPISCNCTAADTCPQGKAGSADRCSILVRPDLLAQSNTLGQVP